MNYSRGFIKIAGWLLQEGKITDREYIIAFWQGIPTKFRARIESRLMSQFPDHNLKNPFSISKVSQVAESLLSWDRFDNDQLGPDGSNEPGAEPASDSDELSDEDSDEDYVLTVVRNKETSQTKERKKVRFSDGQIGRAHV